VNWRAVTAVFIGSLAGTLLPGCGGGSSRPTRASVGASSSRHAAVSPSYSAAKRRYLANFKPDCAAGSRGADASSEYIQRLIEESSRGDLKALPELIIYLNRLAGAFEGALHQARHFGAPPDPGSSYGIAYFRDSEQVIEAIRDLSKSVADINAKGVTSSVNRLASATAAAKVDGQRYGMPMCPSGHSGHSPLLGGQAI
jgi:hypothetical protein